MVHSSQNQIKHEAIRLHFAFRSDSHTTDDPIHRIRFRPLINDVAAIVVFPPQPSAAPRYLY